MIGSGGRPQRSTSRKLSNPEKIRKATLRDNTFAAGAAQDKLKILTGSPTSTTENRAVRYVASGSLQQMTAERLRALGVVDVRPTTWSETRGPQ